MEDKEISDFDLQEKALETLTENIEDAVVESTVDPIEKEIDELFSGCGFSEVYEEDSSGTPVMIK